MGCWRWSIRCRASNRRRRRRTSSGRPPCRSRTPTGRCPPKSRPFWPSTPGRNDEVALCGRPPCTLQTLVRPPWIVDPGNSAYPSSMTMPSQWVRALLIILSIAAAPRGAAAADEKDAGGKVAVTPKNMKFIQIPDMPACATGAMLHGDPRTGPAWVLLKLASGCRVPWHWHTANESLVVISGRGTVEMKDAPALVFAPGAYASLPSHHQHQATCTRSCLLFNAADAAFDIHYVDAKGEEVSLEKARKSPKSARKKCRVSRRPAAPDADSDRATRPWPA